MNIRKLFPCLATVLLLAGLSVTVFAQGRASLRGVINDEFGASIVGATVIITDAAGAQKTATTTAHGTYSFSGLAPATYKINASATGFATSEDSEVDLIAPRRDS